MSELIHNLGIDWKLLVANTITFFVVMWLLRKFAYQPLLQVIEDRQKTAIDTATKSNQINQELQAVQQDSQKIITAAKQEAQQIMQRARHDGDQARQKIVESAEQEATKITAQTKAALNREKEMMINSAKNDLAEMVVVATNSVIREQLDASLQKKLADRALADIKLKS